MIFLGGFPDNINLQVAAEEALSENSKKAVGFCIKQHLVSGLYREALSRARQDQMGKHHFPSPEHHSGPPIDYSTDAIIYVTVVVVFYAAIIILLLTTNFRRKRSQTSSSGQASTRHGDGSTNSRKHWLFFNPISGEAQQASKKESQHFIHRQDAETV